MCYLSIAQIHYKTGNLNNALRNCKKAFMTAKNFGDENLEMLVYIQIGYVLSYSGYNKYALNSFTMALTIAKEKSDRKRMMECYLGIGFNLVLTNYLKEALVNYKMALTIAKEKSDRKMEAKCYLRLGHLHSYNGNPKEALVHCNKALEITKEIGDIEKEYECYIAIANVNRVIGEFKEALVHYYNALKIAKGRNNKERERRCYNYIGLVYYFQQDYQISIINFIQAIDITESIGANLLQDEQRISYFGINNSPYQYLVSMLVQNINKDKNENNNLNIEQAFYYLERGKAQAFRQLLSKLPELKPTIDLNTIKNPQKRQQIEQLFADEKSLLYEIKTRAEIQKQELFSLQQLEPVSTKNLSSRSKKFTYDRNPFILDNRNFKLQKIYNKLKDIDPYYVSLRQVEHVSLKEIQNLLKERENPLSDDKYSNSIIIVEYFLLNPYRIKQKQQDKNKVNNSNNLSISNLYIFLISSDTDKTKIIPVPVSFHQIEKLVKEFNNQTNNFKAEFAGKNVKLSDLYKFFKDDTSKSILCELSKYLIEPIAKELLFITDTNEDREVESLKINATTKTTISTSSSKSVTLCFIPTGILHHIPFHALYLSNEIEDDHKVDVNNDHIFEANVSDIANLNKDFTNKSKIIDINRKYVIEKYQVIYASSAAMLKYHKNNYNGRTNYKNYSNSSNDDKSNDSRIDHNIISNPHSSLYLSSTAFSSPFYMDIDKYVLDEQAKIVTNQNLFPSLNKLQTYCYFDATKEDVVQELGNITNKKKKSSDILHFVGHGFYNGIDPLGSYIFLPKKEDRIDNITKSTNTKDIQTILNSNENKLTARELFQYRIDGTKILTISSCDAAKKKITNGDDIIGLTRSLLYSGASSVLVTLWSVYMPTTTSFMIKFYHNLVNIGMSKGLALQEAQKFMIKGRIGTNITKEEKEVYSHPFIWAPFIMYGDWE